MTVNVNIVIPLTVGKVGSVSEAINIITKNFAVGKYNDSAQFFVKIQPDSILIKVYDDNRLLKRFYSIDEAVKWIKDGMYCCEGAEREHYVKMLGQLEQGNTTLFY